MNNWNHHQTYLDRSEMAIRTPPKNLVVVPVVHPIKLLLIKKWVRDTPPDFTNTPSKINVGIVTI
jgi:hypothetical protein